jgi:hypothetical protein
MQEAKYRSKRIETATKTPPLHHVLDSDEIPAESSVNHVTYEEKAAKKIRIRYTQGRFLLSWQTVENSRQNFIAKPPN